MVRVQERRRLAGTLYAEEVRDLALLWTVDDDHPGEADELAVNCLIAAAGLRSKVGRAEGKLRDAVHATRDLPLCLDLVAGGVLPVEWFEWLIRSTRRLEPAQRRQVDDVVAEWDLAGIDVNRFYRELRMLIAWFGAGLQQEHPTQQRNVEVFTSPDMDGTACLQVTGPVPEVTALGHRLDAAARAVQTAQRQALAADESDLPFDVFGTVAETGRPMSLAALRYAILTRTAFGTEGIEVPESGFRINVTVPVMTLLGQSEAPGEVDGTHPIPPAMARDLVVSAPVFHRVLTDPVDGSFLPRAAKTYQVSRSMQELLRQIDPICAVPGCSHRHHQRRNGPHRRIRPPASRPGWPHEPPEPPPALLQPSPVENPRAHRPDPRPPHRGDHVDCPNPRAQPPLDRDRTQHRPRHSRARRPPAGRLELLPRTRGRRPPPSTGRGERRRGERMWDGK
ncbi:hypothetical protein [Brachybacterium sp. UMB0905]|uniref:hypothetical protein n=1 Tax=Brachybacterium sp. UMB0905 TaxID=2069310 RepID=UPI0011AEE65A|nr:hypothetical protein [Brachybacterium sp. UMB0905]